MPKTDRIGLLKFRVRLLVGTGPVMMDSSLLDIFCAPSQKAGRPQKAGLMPWLRRAGDLIWTPSRLLVLDLSGR
jgi:hypothetical protein